MRIFNICEENRENVEEKVIEAVRNEIDVNIQPSDIDIVHRIGRFNADKSRAIIAKFMCHKMKEQVMCAKRKAKEIKIREDLAAGIKKAFDHINHNRRLYNVESVWTIDGRIKYKFIRNPRPFEI